MSDVKTLLTDLYGKLNPEKVASLDVAKIDSAYGGDYKSMIRDIYAKEAPDKVEVLTDDVLGNIVSTYSLDKKKELSSADSFLGSVGEQEINRQKEEYIDQVKPSEEISKSEISTEKLPDNNPSFGELSGARLKKGLADFYSMVADVPKTLYRVAAIPQNTIASATGIESLRATPEGFSEKTGITNPVSDFYKSQSEINQEVIKKDSDSRKGIIGAFASGDIKAGFKNLSGSIIESAPSTFAMLLSGSGGLKAIENAKSLGQLWPYLKEIGKSYAPMTTVFASGKLQELDRDAPNMSDEAKTMLAIGNGFVENLFERQLGAGAVGEAFSKILKKEGIEQGEKTIKEGLKKTFSDLLVKYPALSPLGEGFEEAATQYTQNLMDKYTGYRPELKLTEGVGDSFLAGLAMGGVFAGALGGTKYAHNRIDKHQENKFKSEKINEVGQQIDNDLSNIANGESDIIRVKDNQGKAWLIRPSDWTNPNSQLFAVDANNLQSEPVILTLEDINKESVETIPANLLKEEKLNEIKGQFEQNPSEVVKEELNDVKKPVLEETKKEEESSPKEGFSAKNYENLSGVQMKEKLAKDLGWESYDEMFNDESNDNEYAKADITENGEPAGLIADIDYALNQHDFKEAQILFDKLNENRKNDLWGQVSKELADKQPLSEETPMKSSPKTEQKTTETVNKESTPSGINKYKQGEIIPERGQDKHNSLSEFKKQEDKLLSEFANKATNREDRKTESEQIDKIRSKRDEIHKELFKDNKADEKSDEVHDSVLSDGEDMPDGYSAVVIDSNRRPIIGGNSTIVEVTNPKGEKYYIDVNTYKEVEIGTEYKSAVPSKEVFTGNEQGGNNKQKKADIERRRQEALRIDKYTIDNQEQDRKAVDRFIKLREQYPDQKQLAEQLIIPKEGEKKFSELDKDVQQDLWEGNYDSAKRKTESLKDYINAKYDAELKALEAEKVKPEKHISDGKDKTSLPEDKKEGGEEGFTSAEVQKVSDKYFVVRHHLDKEDSFDEVVGKPVKLSVDGDFFYFKDNGTFIVSEGMTGTKLGEGKSLKSAITDVEDRLKRNSSTPLTEVINNVVKKTGLSPRYGKNKGIISDGKDTKEFNNKAKELGFAKSEQGGIVKKIGDGKTFKQSRIITSKNGVKAKRVTKYDTPMGGSSTGMEVEYKSLDEAIEKENIWLESSKKPAENLDKSQEISNFTESKVDNLDERRDPNNLWKLTKEEMGDWEKQIAEQKLSFAKSEFEKAKRNYQIVKDNKTEHTKYGFTKSQYVKAKAEYEKLKKEQKPLYSNFWLSDTKSALAEGKFEKAISEGRMTANDAKTIIESAGLEVPKEIVDFVKTEEVKTENVATEIEGVKAEKSERDLKKEALKQSMAERLQRLANVKEFVSDRERADTIKDLYGLVRDAVSLGEIKLEEGIEYLISKLPHLSKFISENQEEIIEIVQLKHAEIDKTREEFGLPKIEGKKFTLKGILAEAEQQIKNGYDVQGLIKEIANGRQETPVEHAILTLYSAELQTKLDINSPDFDKTLRDINNLQLADKPAGTEASQTLLSRKIKVIADNSLADFFLTEMEASGGADLTQKEKEIVIEEHTKITEYEKKLKEYEDKFREIEEQQSLKDAETAFENKRREIERKARKERNTENIDKWQSEYSDLMKELRDVSMGQLSSGIDPKLIEIVTKIAVNRIKVGSVKFADLVDEIYTQAQGKLSKKDITDIIGGKYNNPDELKRQKYELEQDVKNINELEKLESENPKTEKKKREKNQKIAKVRKKLKDDDLSRLKSYKTRALTEIKKIREQLDTDNFERPKPKTVVLDKEAIIIRDTLIKVKKERIIRLAQKKYELRDRYQRAWDKTLEVLNVPRTLMSSMDFSAPLRQGLIASVSHPIVAIKAFTEMFRQSVSQKRFDRWFYDVKEHPLYDISRESGLYIADPHDIRLVAKEEAFMNNLAEKIPIFGKFIKGSERAYVGYLNKLRWDLFSQMISEYEHNGRTFENSPELYKSTGNYINNLTGRGSLGKLENFAPVLSTGLFAPRLIASRVNMLSGYHLWSRKVPKEVRMMYLKDMGKFIGVGLTVLALFKLNGADVEDDPRSTDFGKIKYGNTRWDIWGGHGQYIRVVTQFMLGQTKSTTSGKINELSEEGAFGKTRGDVLLSFVRGKLAPIPAAGWDMITGRTIIGEKVTPQLEAQKLFLPLIAQDLKESYGEGGVSRLLTTAIPATFGVGVQTYDSKKYIQDIMERRAKPKKILTTEEKRQNKIAKAQGEALIREQAMKYGIKYVKP